MTENVESNATEIQGLYRTVYKVEVLSKGLPDQDLQEVANACVDKDGFIWAYGIESQALVSETEMALLLEDMGHSASDLLGEEWGEDAVSGAFEAANKRATLHLKLPEMTIVFAYPTLDREVVYDLSHAIMETVLEFQSSLKPYNEKMWSMTITEQNAIAVIKKLKMRLNDLDFLVSLVCDPPIYDRISRNELLRTFCAE